MQNKDCKKCRRINEKLFLKGEKCFGAKCVLSRKPYAPGMKGKKTRRGGKRGLSEYGMQLRDKQKVKFLYGLREKQFKNYVLKAQKTKGDDNSHKLLELLESRIDNVIFRLGFDDSRSKARQIVSHGHILINDKKVNLPSYKLKIGDKISIRPQSESKNIFKDLDIRLKKYNPPSWLRLDKDKKEGFVVGKLTVEDPSLEENFNSIIGFYSR
ncbi:MAG: 30S ribosomal protein S4 [Patescibacteria group bacterium]